MTNAFAFHGTGGHPRENWFPWLKNELEKLGCPTLVPNFPTPKNQSLENWFKVLEKYEKLLTPETILVGHSLGGAFLLRVLEKIGQPVKAAFFVGTPIGVRPIRNYDADLMFVGKFDFNWPKIRESSKKIFVFQSDNDPYVCLENSVQLARNIGVPLTFVPNAGHFNAAAGYAKFELLLEKIKVEL